mmetsp:Transcript_93947/g.251480  ORF Transcript_93947/g.251480 Transcript_93947/m.251480 type:complete len:355 (-) Transcript_93947:1509-2573(-)
MGPPVRPVATFLGIQGGNSAQSDIQLDSGAKNCDVRLLEGLTQQLERRFRPLESDVEVLLRVPGGTGAYHRVPLVAVLGVHCRLRNSVLPLGPLQPLESLETGGPHQPVSFPRPEGAVVLSPVAPLPSEAEQLVHVVPGLVQLVAGPLLERLPAVHLVRVVHTHVRELQGVRDGLRAPDRHVLRGAQRFPQLLRNSLLVPHFRRCAPTRPHSPLLHRAPAGEFVKIPGHPELVHARMLLECVNSLEVLLRMVLRAVKLLDRGEDSPILPVVPNLSSVVHMQGTQALLLFEHFQLHGGRQHGTDRADERLVEVGLRRIGLHDGEVADLAPIRRGSEQVGRLAHLPWYAVLLSGPF